MTVVGEVRSLVRSGTAAAGISRCSLGDFVSVPPDPMSVFVLDPGPDPEPEQEFSFGEWLRKWFSDEKDTQRRTEHHEATAEGAEDTRMPDLGGNDYYDDEFDDDMVENVIILVLLLAVGVLFVVRQQRRQGNREQQQNGQAPGPQNQAAPGQNPQEQRPDPRNNPWGIPPPPGF